MVFPGGILSSCFAWISTFNLKHFGWASFLSHWFHWVFLFSFLIQSFATQNLEDFIPFFLLSKFSYLKWEFFRRSLATVKSSHDQTVSKWLPCAGCAACVWRSASSFHRSIAATLSGWPLPPTVAVADAVAARGGCVVEPERVASKCGSVAVWQAQRRAHSSCATYGSSLWRCELFAGGLQLVYPVQPGAPYITQQQNRGSQKWEEGIGLQKEEYRYAGYQHYIWFQDILNGCTGLRSDYPQQKLEFEIGSRSRWNSPCQGVPPSLHGFRVADFTGWCY